MSTSRPGLSGLVAVAVSAGVGAFAVADAVLEHRAGIRYYSAIPDALVGWAFITGGMVAYRARRLDRTGALMISCGLVWFGYSIGLYVPAIRPYSSWLAGLGYVLIAQLVLQYPSRVLRSRLERAVLAAAYLQVLAVSLTRQVFAGRPDNYSCPCPATFAVLASRGVSGVLQAESVIAVLVIAAAVLALAVRRWRRSSGPARRALNPLWFAGIATGAALTLQALLGFAPLTAGQASAAGAAAAVIRLSVPAALLAGLVRIRRSRSAVADLVVALGRAPGPAGVQKALASAVGDPSLRVCYWAPETRSYVDADGRTADLAPRPGRAATEVTSDDAPLAMLVHDSELLDQQPLLDAVAAAAGLALENARLQAALAAQLEEVRASRARIVQAGLDERRKVERDLHDGAQQRLLALSLTVSMIGDRAAAGRGPDQDLSRLAETAGTEIRAAIGELRELGRGIHPAVLANEGLAAAAETLAALAPLPVTTRIDPARYPASVEATAYFVIGEALANIARHARASHAEVTARCASGQLTVEIADDGIGGVPARGGTGLVGLADRVAALGGQLAVTSPPGHGTIIKASLPCG
ncbi:MAG: sensor histidine kinase [Streptosporangiaceae bacterium]